MRLYLYDGSYMFRQNNIIHQGAAGFLSVLLQRQYGRRQVMERVVEPMYRRVM
jgi:hypothetical protein